MGIEPFVGASADTFSPLVGSIPDPIDALRKAIAFKVGIAAKEAETQQATAQAQEISTKLNRAQMFQKDLTGVQADPSPQNVSALIMKYPEYGEQIKGGWDVKDKATKDADLTQLGGIYSAAASGNWDLAHQQAQARVDAEKAAGTADAGDEQFVKSLEAAANGDTGAQKNVLAALGTHIAAVAGPDHFASVYGALKGGYTLDAGAARYDDNNNPVAHSPFIKDADGNIRLWTDDGSPPPADGSPTSSTPATGGGFDNAVAHVLKHEGSAYVPSDMNGAPVKYGINQKANPTVDVKNLTEDQAKQIYHDKYWVPSGAENLPSNLQAPYFDVYVRNPSVAQHALQQSGGDPAKFMALSSAYFQNLAKGKGAPYAEAWANRDAENTAIATGQASSDVAAPAHAEASAATGRFPILIPGKSKDAPAGFQWDASGTKLSPIPGGPADPSAEALDPSTTNFYAQEVLAGTPLSQLGFGMGKAAAQNRRQVMSQVAKIAGAEGLDGRDLAVQVAHYRAGMANVQNLEKQLGTVQGNEATFNLNAQQIIARSQQLPASTGSRILNTPIQEYLRQTNDPSIAALDVAVKTAANEYARLITASPSGAGTLTDNARQEYQGVIQGNFPLKQKIAALRQMQIDAANRTKSLKGNLQIAYRHLTDRAPELRGGDSGDSAAALPKDAKVVGTYQGKRVIQLANGKRMVEQ